MELRYAIETLFDELRLEVRREIYIASFSVRGRFGRILSPQFWRDKVNQFIRPVIEQMFRDAGVYDKQVVDQQVRVFEGAAESYSKRVADAIQEEALTADSLKELLRTVSSIDPLSDIRVDQWADNELWSIKQSLAELQAKNQGKTLKRWNTVRDNRVRDFHQAMEGITIPINHVFVVGGELAPRPMYPALSAANRVNCRCYLTYE